MVFQKENLQASFAEGDKSFISSQLMINHLFCFIPMRLLKANNEDFDEGK